MNDYKTILQDRWGIFKKQGKYLSNCEMSFISKDARLNVFFDPVAPTKTEEYFANVLKAELHPELKTFYKWTNGCRLFFASLSVYGITEEKCNDVFVPFDLDYENRNLSKTMPGNKYIYFASIGGSYVFAYDKKSPSKVYGMKVGSTEVLQTYEGFYDFFDHYFDALIDEYDDKGRKIHPTEAYKGIPVLENKCIELL